MVVDGGVISIPLMLGVAAAVMGALGGAGAGCYATTGDWMCRADNPDDFPLAAFDPCNGTEDRVYGAWRPTQSSSADVTITIRASHSHSKGFSKSVDELTTSAAARFTFDVLGGAAWFVTRTTGLSVNFGHAPSDRKSFSQSYELMTQESDSLSVKCPPGIVWQWTLEVSRCGMGPTAVGTRNVRCTPNIEQPPCCMPGYETNPRDPFSGGCVKASSGVDTRLQSPPCALPTSGADVGTLLEAPGEYRQLVEHHAQRLAGARGGMHPLGAAALCIGAMAVTLALAARSSVRRGALLM